MKTLLNLEDRLEKTIEDKEARDSGWKDNLSRIAEAHPRSTLAERHGRKSIKDIKTKQVVEKHLNKKRKK